MKRKSQQLGYFYFFMVAMLLILLATSCASPEQAARDAAEWNDFMTGVLMLITIGGIGFLLLLGLFSIKEWFKKNS